MFTRDALVALLDSAKSLREQAVRNEKDAIRKALAQCDGMPSRAAQLLGVSRQTVKDWLRRQHADLAKEAKAMREKVGYRGGNPHLYPNLCECKSE